tara:strand:+ start:43781 stop:45169 length:1389 start_codon:yes stop_codon:yes gene_type:complete
MPQQFFYDEQIRRFLLQFIRAFSNFQVEYGKDRAGNTTLTTVPVKYGDSTRMVSSIIRENSENKIIPTPMISCYITGLDYNAERRQDPSFIDKKHIRMRKFDVNTNEYTTQQGNAFTIERIMPVPYTLQMSVDIWTSNTNQKLQLLEQILVLFNPALEIQSTDNYLDWTSLSYIELANVQFSSRSVPVGVDEQIDIATLQFTVPIYLSAPAKVKKLGVINKIVASIFDDQGGIADGVIDGQILLGERMKFTPMNFGIIVLGNTIQILDRSETTTNKVDYTPLNDPPTKIGTDDISWAALVNQYGELQPGLSQIRLETGGSAEIIGTVAFHPSDPHKLLFTVQSDTIPTNGLPAITKIINPLRNAPDAGLATAAQGQRYLILNAIGNASNTDGPDAWGSLVAEANDIIEYNGNDWQVAFDSSVELGVHYLTNSNTSIQYKYTGSEWVKSYEGEYRAGDWSLVI